MLFEDVVAIPPPIARLGFLVTNPFARLLILSAGTSVREETLSGVYSLRRFFSLLVSSRRKADMPSFRIKFAMPSARKASLPGFIGTQSSAFAPVTESLGSI